MDPQLSGEEARLPAPLRAAIAIAREWAGPRLAALLLGGSHASGEGVWAELDGRTLTLSDLDLYAILPDAAACRAADERARAAQPQLAGRLLALGLAAPLEVAFLTADGFARMSARPASLELARSARLLMGDARLLARIPRWAATDIAPEEVSLLLENRAFELLGSWPASGEAPALERLRGRHARLKVAADLAGVLALEAGEWPAGTSARIAWAREHSLVPLAAELPGALADAPVGLDARWQEALAWRSGRVLAGLEAVGERGGDRAHWRSVARAWSAVWWHHAGGAASHRDAWALALAVASRAPLRRRLRRALAPASRSGVTPPLGGRVRHLLAGTPQHRVNASAAVLVHAAATSPAAPALPAGALRALRTLGVAQSAEWEGARREVVRAWDLWVLDGQRTAAAP